MHLRAVEVLGGLDRDACLAMAAALESALSHPIAHALVKARPPGRAVFEADGIRAVAAELGFSPPDFVSESYVGLFFAGGGQGDMVFPG
jgi:hypothetical protein